MKKAKNVFAIIAISFAVLGVAILALFPAIDGVAASLTEGAPAAMTFAQHLENIIARIKALFDFGWISSGFTLEAIKENLAQSIIIVASAIGIILLIVLFIMILVKKHAKSLGWFFPLLIVFAVTALSCGIHLIPNLYICEPDHLAVAESAYIGYASLILIAAAGVLFIIAFILYLVYMGKVRKASKVVEAEAPAVEAVPAEAEAVPAAAAAVVAGEVSEAKVSEEKNSKVIRRILVHKSGKVIRVLNEHYFDVTTNIFVDPGYADPTLPEETEQQHFEKIIKGSMKATPVAQKAPVAPIIVKKTVPTAPVGEKAERIPFAIRLKQADKALKVAYNELKSEILSYGIKSRISIAGDTFRLHTKTYVKLVVAGKSLKLYFALDPKDYKDSTFPIGDASKKVLHKETPLVFKVKSDLSVRRAKQLIADAAAKDKLVQGEVVKHDHAKEVK